MYKQIKTEKELKENWRKCRVKGFKRSIKRLKKGLELFRLNMPIYYETEK